MRTIPVVLVIVAFSLGTAACTAEPPAGIPTTLWNQGAADPLKPIGLVGQGAPKPAPLATSYQEGLDDIGDWRLLEINDGGAQLVIQYSQDGCAVGQGVIVAQTSADVALVPIYRNGPEGTPCDAVLHVPIGIITLAKPLGDRRLLHLPGDGTMQPPTQPPPP
ncbi:hypothetical protein V3C33_10520 [Micrococcaceae bacterium Sec5.7]